MMDLGKGATGRKEEKEESSGTGETKKGQRFVYLVKDSLSLGCRPTTSGRDHTPGCDEDLPIIAGVKAVNSGQIFVDFQILFLTKNTNSNYSRIVQMIKIIRC
jgi:hypothetical protein